MYKSAHVTKSLNTDRSLKNWKNLCTKGQVNHLLVQPIKFDKLSKKLTSYQVWNRRVLLGEAFRFLQDAIKNCDHSALIFTLSLNGAQSAVLLKTAVHKKRCDILTSYILMPDVFFSSLSHINHDLHWDEYAMDFFFFLNRLRYRNVHSFEGQMIRANLTWLPVGRLSKLQLHVKQAGSSAVVCINS